MMLQRKNGAGCNNEAKISHLYTAKIMDFYKYPCRNKTCKWDLLPMNYQWTWQVTTDGHLWIQTVQVYIVCYGKTTTLQRYMIETNNGWTPQV